MAESPVIIRPGTREDLPAICDLLERTARQSIVPTLSESGARRLGELFRESALRDRFDQGFRFHVASAGEALIGVAVTRDDRHLYFLFVDADHQRRGVGRRLWAAAREACEAAGHEGPYTVNASENALDFYRRLGFRGDRREVTDGIVYWPMTLGAGP